MLRTPLLKFQFYYLLFKSFKKLDMGILSNIGGKGYSTLTIFGDTDNQTNKFFLYFLSLNEYAVIGRSDAIWSMT